MSSPSRPSGSWSPLCSEKRSAAKSDDMGSGRVGSGGTGVDVSGTDLLLEEQTHRDMYNSINNHIHVLMRDEKEGRKKKANKQGKATHVHTCIRDISLAHMGLSRSLNLARPFSTVSRSSAVTGFWSMMAAEL